MSAPSFPFGLVKNVINLKDGAKGYIGYGAMFEHIGATAIVLAGTKAQLQAFCLALGVPCDADKSTPAAVVSTQDISITRLPENDGLEVEDDGL